MSQRPLTPEPATSEEYYYYLADTILEEGSITSDNQPLVITRDSAINFFDDFNAESLRTGLLFKSWEDEESENEIKFMEHALELTRSSTVEMLKLHIEEDKLRSWGPEQ